jgi:putative FmdB family regulatory protein
VGKKQGEVMPTYAYMCKQCGGYDVSQPITAQPLSTCPICGGLEIKRVFSAAAVQFKGSGFYSTDK